MEAFEKLKALVVAAEEDILKVAGGNKAAGTRVRKQMQDIKKAARTCGKPSSNCAKRNKFAGVAEVSSNQPPCGAAWRISQGGREAARAWFAGLNLKQEA